MVTQTRMCWPITLAALELFGNSGKLNFLKPKQCSVNTVLRTHVFSKKLQHLWTPKFGAALFVWKFFRGALCYICVWKIERIEVESDREEIGFHFELMFRYKSPRDLIALTNRNLGRWDWTRKFRLVAVLRIGDLPMSSIEWNLCFGIFSQKRLQSARIWCLT